MLKRKQVNNKRENELVIDCKSIKYNSTATIEGYTHVIETKPNSCTHM